MTPLEIEILLHYRSRTVDFRDGDFSAPAVREAIDRFKVEDMLCCDDKSAKRAYRLTDRAECFINHICALPYPVQRWEMP